MSLALTNVVQISVAQPPRGLAEYEVSNLATITQETPIVAQPLGYGVYKTPFDVGTDYGTTSEVYAQAIAIFSQDLNILTGGGSLIVFPVDPGTLLADAIPAALQKIFFGGVMWAGYTPNDAEVLAASTVAQVTKTILFASSYLAASLNPGGVFYQIQAASQKFTRMWVYTEGGTPLAARLSMAAYASRLMSVDFSGSNTTNTMQMKDLVNVLPDTGITQTILNLCETVGVDCYASIAGLPKVFSFGANGGFSDEIFNLTWFVLALQVAGFNAIAQTSTKLPQTEPGVATLKNAYMQVLQQGVTCGYLAPGAWNSPELFGNPEDLRRNIEELGWYIYSTPVNRQSQVDRVARKAPLIQIAAKEAGAIHSSSVIIYVNA